MEPDELEDVVRLWMRSKQDAYPWHRLERSRGFEDQLAYFRDDVGARCRVWLAVEGDALVGLLALEGGGHIDQLYVDPEAQGRGVGTRLVAKARERSPTGLTLHTFQRNAPARRFYEARGFEVIGFGISPPPENEPDVQYAWRPESLR